jgi:hypothetical protein
MKVTIERVENGLILRSREDCNGHPLAQVFEVDSRAGGDPRAYEELFLGIKEAFGDYDMCVRVRSKYFEVTDEIE